MLGGESADEHESLNDTDAARDKDDLEHVEEIFADRPRTGKKKRANRRRQKTAQEDLVKERWIPLPKVYAAMGMENFENISADNVQLLNGGRDELDNDPEARIYSNAEVLKSDPAEYEQWRLSAEREVQESFYKMGAVSVTTEEELRTIGGHAHVLPMKVVWVLKAGKQYKCRGVVCGNFSPRDPCEAVWTAQAEPSSVFAALRLAQLRSWGVTQIDIKGAFMYASLPGHVLIVVRPPAIWVKMGLVPQGTLWTLRKAVYGLRVAPRAWGEERDRQFRQLTAKTTAAEGRSKHGIRLRQCAADSQVWMIIPDSTNAELLGLLVVYVDDMLIGWKSRVVCDAILSAFREIWELSTERQLSADCPLLFLGLEIEKCKKTKDLIIHQRTFTKALLARHGIDGLFKPLSSISIPPPDTDDGPPNSQELKALQQHSGEFNWLATRTRMDISYVVSLIASASSRYKRWTLTLCKKLLRYILYTADQVMRYSADGCEGDLWCWSDAGYGGPGSKSQTGVVIVWGNAVVTWRSSRQPTAALSTAEAEIGAASMTFCIAWGVRCLLVEWGVDLSPPVVCVDNQAALTMITDGGTWRTRYYAVRATRMHDEMTAGNISVRYCVTCDMIADALTKLCTAVVLEMARRAMEGTLPRLPGADQGVKITDSTWWGALLLMRPDLRPYRCSRTTRVSTDPGPQNRSDAIGDGPAENWGHVDVTSSGSEQEPVTDVAATADAATATSGTVAATTAAASSGTVAAATAATPPASSSTPTPACDDDKAEPKKKKRRGAKKRPTGDQRTHRRWATLEEEEWQ